MNLLPQLATWLSTLLLLATVVPIAPELVAAVRTQDEGRTDQNAAQNDRSDSMRGTDGVKGMEPMKGMELK